MACTLFGLQSLETVWNMMIRPRVSFDSIQPNGRDRRQLGDFALWNFYKNRWNISISLTLSGMPGPDRKSVPRTWRVFRSRETRLYLNFNPKSKNPADMTKSSDPKPHRRADRQANPGDINPGIYLTWIKINYFSQTNWSKNVQTVHTKFDRLLSDRASHFCNGIQLWCKIVCT